MITILILVASGAVITILLSSSSCFKFEKKTWFNLLFAGRPGLQQTYCNLHFSGYVKISTKFPIAQLMGASDYNAGRRGFNSHLVLMNFLCATCGYVNANFMLCTYNISSWKSDISIVHSIRAGMLLLYGISIQLVHINLEWLAKIHRWT